MKTVREVFEDWAVEQDLDTSCYIDDGVQGDYCDVVAQYAWLGWQAAIELGQTSNETTN